MSETPGRAADSEPDASEATTADAASQAEAEKVEPEKTPPEKAEPEKAQPKRESEEKESEMARRERWLRLALFTVGAALIASIFSLYGQRSDDDPTAAAAETADANSGTATIDLTVDDNGDAGSTRIETRYVNDDYDTTVGSTGTVTADDRSEVVQRVIVVDGVVSFRAVEGEPWTAGVEPASVAFDTSLPLPDRTAGWSSDGLEPFIEALGLSEGESSNDVTGDVLADGSTTVDDIRAMASVPLAAEVLADPAWGWPTGQPVEVSLIMNGGRLIELVLEAEADAAQRAEGALTVSAVTSYADLDAGEPIAVPDS